MKKYLILVKHSLPEIVKNLPAREWKLSKEGQERAWRLAERLIEYQPDIVVSSVEPKATETAEIIATKLGLAVYTINGLYEHDRSNVPFLPNDQFQIAIHEFFSKPAELVFGNETADQAYNRFNQSVLSVLNYHQRKTVVLVAHGTVISLFVSRLTEMHGFSLWSELGLPSFILVDLQANTLVKKENIT